MNFWLDLFFQTARLFKPFCNPHQVRKIGRRLHARFVIYSVGATKQREFSPHKGILQLTLTTPSLEPVMMTFWLSHSLSWEKQTHRICWSLSLRPVAVFTLATSRPLMVHRLMWVPAHVARSPCTIPIPSPIIFQKDQGLHLNLSISLATLVAL